MRTTLQQRLNTMLEHKLVRIALLVSLVALVLFPATKADALYLVKDAAGVLTLDGEQSYVTDKRIVVTGAVSNDPNIRLLANQDVSITRNGTTVPAVSQNETVSSLLSRLGYSVSPLELVMIDVSDPNVVSIEISDNLVFYESVQEHAAFKTEYVDNYTLPKGESVEVQSGQDGTCVAVYEVVYADGEFLSRQLVDITEDTSVPCIVEVGTLVKEAARGDTIREVITYDDGSGYLLLNSGDALHFREVREITATAYSSEEKRVGEITATGTQVHVGVVAVDKNVFALGTSMFIVSPCGSLTYGYAHAEDTGVRGNVVDLYMETIAQCKQFGRRPMLSYILD